MVSMFLSLVEARQLLVIVLWLSIPLIILSLIIATIWHYRRKRIYARIESPEIITDKDALEIFESSLSLVAEERDAMQKALENATNRIHYLEEKLRSAELKCLEFERRWETNSQLISRIYREMEESRNQSVIIN